MTKMLAVKFRNGRQVMVPMHAVQAEIAVVNNGAGDPIVADSEAVHSYTLRNVYTGDVIGQLTETEFASVAAQLATFMQQ